MYLIAYAHRDTYRRGSLQGFPHLPGCKVTSSQLTFNTYSLLGEQGLEYLRMQSHIVSTIQEKNLVLLGVG